MLQQHLDGQVKFKDLIDFYLTSSKVFASNIRAIDAGQILGSIEVPQECRESRFNEQVLRLLCLNQAIEKMNKE